jgi:hypothetical protein
MKFSIALLAVVAGFAAAQDAAPAVVDDKLLETAGYPGCSVSLSV